MLPFIRIDLYKTARLEAQTLRACGLPPDQISIEEIYGRLLKDEEDGTGQEIPTQNDFKKHEADCRAKGIRPY